ncbi:Spc98 family-domain-containing protein [Astrocystis sublimbata]|nr:Spc98 family-domain-containing protein [Astrocystis sublimbata]
MAFAAQLGSLTDELIEIITSTTTQTDRARFDTWRESSLRNLRQHSFLRTNQFEVYSALDGYEERFRILNRGGLADALRDRIDALALCSNKTTPDVLDLLLKLADQPVQKSRLDDLSLLKKTDEPLEPTLKWSDIANEDGWDEDGELWQNADLGGYSSGDEYIEYETDASAPSEDTSLSSFDVRYRRRPVDYIESLQRPLNLDIVRNSQAWRNQKSLVKPTANLSIPCVNVPITESQVIREVLFMLGGLDNELSDRQGEPSARLQLLHTSGEIFASLLVSVNDAREKISLLRQYAKHQQEIPLLQVFQTGVESCVQSFDKIVASMQARCESLNTGMVVSLLKLWNDLEPHISPLKHLAEIVGQLQRSKSPPPFYFLELLFDSAQTLQLVGDGGSYRFIGQLFFECFAVYLRPIRYWMQNGELTDNDGTFFIARSKLKVIRPRVWDDQFTLRKDSEGLLFAPRFLQPAATRIFTTGKSIVVLKLLGKHQSATTVVSEKDTQFNMSAVSHLIPFSEIFKGMFGQWMQSKHHAASATLKQTLFQTYNLWSDLDMLQHVYLMTDGSRSEHFSYGLFNNIDVLNTHWHDRFLLTEMAREAFDGVIEPYRLNVNIVRGSLAPDVKDVRQTVRGGLSLIHITLKLPWITRIVITEESLDHYQLVFSFLLQLQRASQVLTRHRILSDDNNYSADQESFYYLRYKLIWFCNTIQSYLSTLVLGPLIANIREQMEQAEDIDQMLTSHSTLTKRMVHEACLGGKLEPIRQGILDILDLAIRLRDARQSEEERNESKSGSNRSPWCQDVEQYHESSDEGGETYFDEQEVGGAPLRNPETTYNQTLDNTRSAFDRHMKFIVGGLRGVARASSSEAASKWDILAEMLEVGI